MPSATAIPNMAKVPRGTNMENINNTIKEQYTWSRV
jgi:hypothetical protein